MLEAMSIWEQGVNWRYRDCRQTIFGKMTSVSEFKMFWFKPWPSHKYFDKFSANDERVDDFLFLAPSSLNSNSMHVFVDIILDRLTVMGPKQDCW